MGQSMIVDESLEQLLEGIERREAAAEDDAEAALDELIDEMADIRAEPAGTEHMVRRDEFVCEVCNLILNRSQMAGRGYSVCVECANAPLSD
jgi:Domain of unknown function (DUF4193)